ncbi:hypothetical protein JTP67_05965 [Streptomyces sp. S12]|uniref:hypothetical protein n=1 Tax=Streptomyces sp. NPDC057115 TaxID=3346022 RepID=UPI001961A5F2|nr:hypothetical protein [Streptomyces sp. S12]
MAHRSVPTPSPHASPRTCTSCGGNAGRTITTRTGRKTVKAWQRCEPCKGTGIQGGGI